MIDTYDDYNPINPINEKELDPTELEICEQEKWKTFLKMQDYYIQLKKLAEIEQCLLVFGNLTYEQMKEKKEILNQYI